MGGCCILVYLCIGFIIFSVHCTMVHPWWRLQWESLPVEWGVPKCVSLVGITETSLLLHLIHEIWQTPLTHQPKVVVPSVQVIYNGALVLPLLSAPQAGQETDLMLESLRGVYALETHYFWGFERHHYPEIMEVFGRSPHHIVGTGEFLPASPLVLNWVDFGTQETHHLLHLSKDISQLIRKILIEGWQMGL